MLADFVCMFIFRKFPFSLNLPYSYNGYICIPSVLFLPKCFLIFPASYKYTGVVNCFLYKAVYMYIAFCRL